MSSMVDTNGFESKIATLRGEEAVEWILELLEILPDDDAKISTMAQVGASLVKRTEQGGDLELLTGALLALESALDMVTSRRGFSPSIHSEIAHVFRIRFDRTGNVNDLSQEVVQFQKAVDVVPKSSPERAFHYANLSRAQFVRYEILRVDDDLDRCGLNWLEAVRGSPRVGNDYSHPSRIGDMFWRRYERTQHAKDLDQVIIYEGKGVEIAPDSDPVKVIMLFILFSAYRTRYNLFLNLEDLERSISVMEKLVKIIPNNHPDRALRLIRLGEMLAKRFERLGRPNDLEESISNQRLGIKLTPRGEGRLPEFLDELGHALDKRYQRLQQVEDLEEMISIQQRAASITFDSDINKPVILMNLSNRLKTRYEANASEKDLEDAVLAAQKACDLIPAHDPKKGSFISQLGKIRAVRAKHYGRMDDTEEIVAHLRDSIDQASDDDPHIADYFMTLAYVYAERFDTLQRTEDLQELISCEEMVAQLVPNEDVRKSQALFLLGMAQWQHFGRNADFNELENAIFALEQGAELSAESFTDKSQLFNILGCCYSARFIRKGVPKDMQGAVSCFEKALEFGPAGIIRKSSCLFNLGCGLRIRFEHLGNLDDLENAISRLKEALEIIPPKHEERPPCLNRLGTALLARYQRLGSMADLNAAIEMQQEAVESTLENHDDRVTWIMGLAQALLARSQQSHTHSREDLDRSIQYYRNAAALMPPGAEELPGIRTNMASTVMQRYRNAGDPKDLDEALAVLQRAASDMAEGSPRSNLCLNNLGTAFSLKFEQTNELHYLESSISYIQKAVDLISDDDPVKVANLNNLGQSLQRYFHLDKNLETADRTIQIFKKAALLPNGVPRLRFMAATQWALTVEARGLLTSVGYSNSLPAWQCALSLLPRIAWLVLTVEDQHGQLTNAGEMVREAVCAAIGAEEYELAIEWAEQGRSIVWQNLLRLRTSLEELHAAHPELANRLRTVSREIEILSSPDGPAQLQQDPGSAANATRTNVRLGLEWDRAVEEVRTLPGFEGFLKPPTLDKLSASARDGPVIVLNVALLRCDALAVVGDGDVVHIPLERFSTVAGRQLLDKFRSLLHMVGVRESDSRKFKSTKVKVDVDAAFQDVLRVLWLDVVQPVMEGLAYSAHPEELPRIWWCPTGPLAFLPLHAAGIYGSTAGDKLHDYVVSSYTPTLSALLAEPPSIEPKDFQILAVAQSHTPGASQLPCTLLEVEKIVHLAQNLRTITLVDEAATRKSVVEAMKKSSWAHLACHGEQSIENPMQSGLLLQDGKLELSEMTRMNLPNADFAFLSACQTAVGDEMVEEEAVHLAAGMLFAGYRGVVATMWSIKDEYAPIVAEHVYRHMLKGGEPKRSEAARGLSEAIRQLRDSGADLLSWVPFIHIGR